MSASGSASALPTTVQDGVCVGVAYRPETAAPLLGHGGVLRRGTVIYNDVIAGDYLQTGHNVVIREQTRIGDHVVVGTNTVIDGHASIGNFVKIETGCYVPTHTTIGSRVFIGPGVVLTNDRFPLKMRERYKPEGPVVEDFVTIGAGAVLLPGVRLGRGCFVAAGAVVTTDVPPSGLAQGSPAKILPMPPHLEEENMALSWRAWLEATD